MSAALVLGLAEVLYGLLAVAFAPELLLTRNGAGNPRWLPHAVSLALALAAIATWRPRLDCGVLAAWWALAAGAFAGAAPRLAGWLTLSPGAHAVLLAPAAAAVLAVAISPTALYRARLAALMALAAPVFVFLALAMPPRTERAYVLDAAAYTFILAASGFSVAHGLHIRRSS